MGPENNLKYSIIYLNYDPENRKDWTEETMELLKDNTQGYNVEIIEVKDVEGYANAVNEGFRRATGDYLVVMNDDFYIGDPIFLVKLASFQNSITSWRMVPFYMNQQEYPDGALWGLYKKDQEKIGLMDEEFGKGYGCDEVDYFYRAKELGVDWNKIQMNARHGENKTYQAYFKPMKEDMTAQNVWRFKKKWAGKFNI